MLCDNAHIGGGHAQYGHELSYCVVLCEAT